MKTFLVGGAVRDQLLGIPVVERDYVVVGATREAMLARGYREVGRDFPVFLHPETREEFALARTERKTGPGHRGFECRFGPDVTLEEDLLRRDLTINAMAMDEAGNIIDPHGGQADIRAKRIRHVSAAFAEDPLRILRIARFKAAFHHLAFEVNSVTIRLLKQMIAEGQLDELTPERVLGELDKALATPNPAEFFYFVDAIGGSEALWPEISRNDMNRLRQADVTEPESRFALLFLDQQADAVDLFCKRLKCSSQRQAVTRLIVRHISDWQRLWTLNPEDIAKLVLAIDGVRMLERFRLFNGACEEITAAGLAASWLEVQSILTGVKARDLADTTPGPALGARVKSEQVSRLRQWRQRQAPDSPAQ